MLTLSRSSVMVVPSSHQAQRSCVVSSSLDTSAFRKAVSSPAGQVANQTINLALDMSKERIRTLFHNVDLSISAYDTAWVAMVPSTNSLNAPCFPNSLEWLMDNQLNDGSWGLRDHDPWVKDSLSSTLACILALKRWDVGEDQINKGLCFIESNCASATDMNQPSPVGFDIIFPHMLGYANDLNIKLPFKQKDLSLMLNERELELRRCDSEDMEAYLAYVSEGLGTFYDHNILTKYQMKNGSVLNSPSATSAALIHHRSNDGCLNYLSSLLGKFGNAVPTVYPLGLYLRLCMVDALERLGFSRHFKVEVGNVLDETYRCWMQRDDQVFMDINTCALAFRILRMHGYEVSLDPLAEITKEPLKDVYTALEVHKASHVISEGELAYDQTYTTATAFLKLSTATVPSNRISELIQKEVETALKFPFNGDLERIYARRSIEHYNVNDTRILKTAYRSSNISNEDYVMFAVEDYNTTQSIYREEVKSLERWMVELRLSDLEYARKNSPYCYFSVAATFSSPELADARISWAKNSILVTIVDDFFDVGGSMDEFTNLIHCVEKWDVDVDTDCCSEQVEILFLALKDIISWTRDRSFEWQARDVTTHVIEIWLSMLRNMLQEAIWVRDACMPTINEYMENGYVTIGIGPTLLPSLYFVGPPLSDEIVQSSEYHKLFKIVSTQGRLLNDIRSYKRELKAGKSNAVPLHMKQGKGEIDEEKAVKEIKILIEKQRSKLLKLVLKTEGSIVPRACKDGFWNMSNVLNLFYAKDDGFTGRAILDVVKQVIYEPVSHKLMLFNGIQENA